MLDALICGSRLEATPKLLKPQSPLEMMLLSLKVSSVDLKLFI